MNGVKPKRRRRLATPPPDDPGALIEDIYDQGVSNAFNELKSVKTSRPLHEMVCVRSLSADSSGNDSPLVDLSDSVVELAEVNSIIEDTALADVLTQVVECEPSSPPPPPVLTRKHRFGKGVKAAFDKLETNLQHSYTDDLYQQVTADVVADSNGSGQQQISTVKVRVRMPSGVQKYELNINEKLYSIREEVARRQSVAVNRISFFYNDSEVTNTDTVQSLGVTVADTVEVYILAEGAVSEETKDSLINIKVQGKGGQRDVEHIALAPGENMGVLMKKFAESKKLEMASLTFHFDGDEISATDTPASLDMDDGDCVDVTGY